MKAADYEMWSSCSRGVPREHKHLTIERLWEVENHYRKLWVKSKSDFNTGNIKFKKKMEEYMELKDYLVNLWWGKKAIIEREVEQRAIEKEIGGGG